MTSMRFPVVALALGIAVWPLTAQGQSPGEKQATAKDHSPDAVPQSDTLRRASELADDASRHFDQIMPRLQGRGNEQPRPTRMAQSSGGRTEPGSGAMPSEDFLAPLWTWLDSSNRQYQRLVVRPLSTGGPAATSLAGEAEQRRPSGAASPAVVPPRSSEPPAAAPVPRSAPPVVAQRTAPTMPPTSSQAGKPPAEPGPIDQILNAAHSWFDRANREYRTVIVKRLEQPGGAPPSPMPEDPSRVTAVAPPSPVADRQNLSRLAEDAGRQSRAEQGRRMIELAEEKARRDAALQKKQLTQQQQASPGPVGSATGTASGTDTGGAGVGTGDAARAEDARRRAALAADERRRIAQEAEQRRLAAVEQARRADEARKAEEARMAREARAAEEQRQAAARREAAAKLEQQRASEAARRQEAARLAEKRRSDELARAAQEKAAGERKTAAAREQRAAEEARAQIERERLAIATARREREAREAREAAAQAQQKAAAERNRLALASRPAEVKGKAAPNRLAQAKPADRSKAAGKTLPAPPPGATKAGTSTARSVEVQRKRTIVTITPASKRRARTRARAYSSRRYRKAAAPVRQGAARKGMRSRPAKQRGRGLKSRRNACLQNSSLPAAQMMRVVGTVVRVWPAQLCQPVKPAAPQGRAT